MNKVKYRRKGVPAFAETGEIPSEILTFGAFFQNTAMVVSKEAPRLLRKYWGSPPLQLHPFPNSIPIPKHDILCQRVVIRLSSVVSGRKLSDVRRLPCRAVSRIKKPDSALQKRISDLVASCKIFFTACFLPFFNELFNLF